MTHLIVFVSMTLFGSYFFLIGAAWVALVPLVCGIIFTINSLYSYQPNRNIRQVIEQNSLYFSRILILLGISGLFVFLGIDPIYTAIYMIIINLILWLGSYISSYRDGIKLFHIMYYLSYIALIITASTVMDRRGILIVIGYTIPLHLGLYAFITFIIGTYVPIGKGTKGLTYAYAHLTLIRGVFSLVGEITLLYLIFAQLYLTLTYYITNYILGKEYRHYAVKPIDAKDILAGKKVLDHQRRIQIQEKKKPKGMKIFKEFLGDLDPRINLIIDSYNSILVLIIIGYYIIVFSNNTPILYEQFLYWTSILLFFINFIFIQKHDRLPTRQRVFVFIIINFAIYTNIIYLSGSEALVIAPLGIMRNIANSLLILYSKNIIPYGLIRDEDYWYWIVANILGIPINIFFLGQINVAGSLLFALVSTYVGLQGFLLYYNIKYVKKEINAE